MVFKYPEDPRRDFIKRVIAIGGETVEGRDRLIYVDGKPIPEPYVKHTSNRILPHDESNRDNFGPIHIPEGKVFVIVGFGHGNVAGLLAVGTLAPLAGGLIRRRNFPATVLTYELNHA